MKQLYSPFLFLLLFSSMSVFGQDKTKKSTDKKISEYDEIVIKQKNPGKDTKVTVEVRDGNVIVNGKPIEKFEDNEVIVKKRSPHYITLNDSRSPFREPGMAYDIQMNKKFNLDAEAHPFLGVSTEKTENGVRVQNVTENSGAQKAGIKTGDIITKVNEKKIESPEQLSEMVTTFKPKDKISVTVKRDGKEMKLNAVLGQREAPMAMTFHNME